jgi:T-complex protein 1 subunit alpha
VIPKTLANNAALDAIDLIAQLRVLHSASQNSDDDKKKELRFCGLDLVNNKCRNNM